MLKIAVWPLGHGRWPRLAMQVGTQGVRRACTRAVSPRCREVHLATCSVLPQAGLECACLPRLGSTLTAAVQRCSRCARVKGNSSWKSCCWDLCWDTGKQLRLQRWTCSLSLPSTRFACLQDACFSYKTSEAGARTHPGNIRRARRPNTAKGWNSCPVCARSSGVNIPLPLSLKGPTCSC